MFLILLTIFTSHSFKNIFSCIFYQNSAKKVPLNSHNLYCKRFIIIFVIIIHAVYAKHTVCNMYSIFFNILIFSFKLIFCATFEKEEKQDDLAVSSPSDVLSASKTYSVVHTVQYTEIIFLQWKYTYCINYLDFFISFLPVMYFTHEYHSYHIFFNMKRKRKPKIKYKKYNFKFYFSCHISLCNHAARAIYSVIILLYCFFCE